MQGDLVAAHPAGADTWPEAPQPRQRPGALHEHSPGGALPGPGSPPGGG